MSSSPITDFDEVDTDKSKHTPSDMPEFGPADIRFAAMDFLARREHTRRELQQKLQRRFPDTTMIETEVQRLRDENLQSDERFAENFVRYRASRGFGLIHIRQDMRQRGLSDVEIARAVECAAINWLALAETVYLKKYGEKPAVDIKNKAKRARYMQYRGFSSDEYQSLL